MAVLRNTNEFYSDVNAIITYGVVGGFLLIFIGVLGIKWKWFKHRLTFEQVPTTEGSANQHEPKIIKATFRNSCDFDSIVNVTPIKTLPPIRISNAMNNQPITLPRVSRKSLAPPIPKEHNRIESKQVTTTITSKYRISQHRCRSEFDQQQCSDGVFKLLSVTPPATLSPFYAVAAINDNKLDEIRQTSHELVSVEEIDNNVIQPKLKEKQEKSPPPYKEVDPIKNEEIKPVLGAILRAEAIKVKSKEPSTINQPTSKHQTSLDKKNAFLYQVPIPVEIPTLKLAAESSISVLNLAETNTGIEFNQLNSVHAKEDIEVIPTHKSLNDKPSPTDGFQVLFGEEFELKKDEILSRKNGNKLKDKPKESKVKSPKIKKVRVLKDTQKKKESTTKQDKEANKKEVMDKERPSENKGKIVKFDVEEIQPKSDETSLAMPTEIPKPKFRRRKDQVSKENTDAPVPMPRKFSLPKEEYSDKISEPLSIKSEETNDDFTWDLVAKHRLNTRAITTTQQQIAQIHTSPNSDQSRIDNNLQMQQRQIDMITKPKTIREMRRQQIDDGRLVISGQSTAKINQNGDLKLKAKNNDEESDTEA